MNHDRKKREYAGKLQNLIISAQSGNKLDCVLLLKEFYKMAKRNLETKIRPVELREEIIQEILIGVHKSLHTYDPKHNPMPWFYSIVRYKLVDFFRKNKNHEFQLPEVPTDILKVDPTQLTNLEQNEILELIEILPKKQKLAIQMTKFEKHSIKEAALLLGETESNVKISVHRGLKRLRKEIYGAK